MKKDRIQVFNSALDKHLNDLAYFEDLVTKHYLKFAYGYNIISADEVIHMIDDIECVLKKDHIIFIINTCSELTDDLIHLLKRRIVTAWDHTTYDADMSISGAEIQIKIAKR